MSKDLKDCNICKTENCAMDFISDSEVMSCTKCKSIFSNNYKGSFPNITSSSKFKLFFQKRFSQIVAENYMNYLKKNTKLQFKSAFDIGAGYGDFVLELNKLGINAKGIEADKNSISKKASKKIICGSFNEEFNGDKFDLISVNQCLYYFDNSFSILKKIEHLLNKNGVIFVVTVNPESSFRIKNKIWTQGCKMCLSKNIFENLEEIGLKCLGITSFNDNFYQDYFLHKTGKLSNFQFWLNALLYVLKLKKIITQSNDGIHNFVLLKKI